MRARQAPATKSPENRDEAEKLGVRLAREWAKSQGRSEQTDRLLSLGANPSQIDPRSGRSALHWAVRLGDLAEVRKMLAAGADVEQIDGETGNSPLIMAIVGEKIGVVKELLKAGADPNRAVDEEGPAPLMVALGGDGRSAELTRLLLAAGAIAEGRQSIEDRESAGVLEVAVGSGSVGALEAIWESLTPKQREEQGAAAMSLAAEVAEVEALMALVDWGAKQQGMVKLEEGWVKKDALHEALKTIEMSKEQWARMLARRDPLRAEEAMELAVSLGIAVHSHDEAAAEVVGGWVESCLDEASALGALMATLGVAKGYAMGEEGSLHEASMEWRKNKAMRLLSRKVESLLERQTLRQEGAVKKSAREGGSMAPKRAPAKRM